jgi:hypothetical protein
MTGIEMIAEERKRPIETGIFSAGGFADRAIYHVMVSKHDSKTRFQQLAIAGALIAAEIDRLLVDGVNG